MAVPQWFRDRVSALKDAGFLGNVELSDEDLDFQWERHAGENEPGILERMLAHHRSRACEPPQVLLNRHARIQPCLERYQDITRNRLVLGDLSEKREGQVLRSFEVSTPRGRWEIAVKARSEPNETYPVVDTMSLLAALNTIADSGAFCLVNGNAIFVDAREREALATAAINVVDIAKDEALVRLVDGAAKPKRIVKKASLSEAVKSLRDDSSSDISHAIRKAYRPQLVPNGSDQLCKLGGQPWGSSEPPRCDRCQGPMALLFQAGFADLPIKIVRPGTLQVFVCRGRDFQGCFIDGQGVSVRVLTGSVSAPTERAAPELPRRPIAAWTAFDDLPSSSDWAEARLDEDVADDEDIEADDGFKCGGWPAWVQDRAGACKTCGKECVLALQVPSHDDLQFGDCGLVYVLVCDNARCRKWAGAVIQYS